MTQVHFTQLMGLLQFTEQDCVNGLETVSTKRYWREVLKETYSGCFNTNECRKTEYGDWVIEDKREKETTNKNKPTAAT